MQQICLFLLAESRHIPAWLVQASPPGRKESVEGTYRVIDLDLSRYDLLRAEVERLRSQWQSSQPTDCESATLGGLLASSQLDQFDCVQLEEVVRVCRQSKSLSDAGRQLFAVSRTAKAKPNDADRLRKYLARFGLSWNDLARRGDVG